MNGGQTVLWHADIATFWVSGASRPEGRTLMRSSLWVEIRVKVDVAATLLGIAALLKHFM